MNKATNIQLVVALVILGLLVPAVAGAEQVTMSWSVISSGGGANASPSCGMTYTIAQPLAEYAGRDRFLCWIGYWYPEDGEQSPPMIVRKLRAAKFLPNGTKVSIAGRIATSGRHQVTGVDDRFSGFFYIEEQDRTSGIRVSCPSWPVAGLFRGSRVNVMGVLGTTPEGERCITGAMVIVGATTDVPPPIGMNHELIGGQDLGVPPLGQYGAIGRKGLNNIGLLVKTWGQIVGSGPGYLVIDDGFGMGVRIDTTGLAEVPTEGFVTVVGISSLDVDRLPSVLPRTILDIDAP